MDISFNFEESSFNYRVAGVIKYNNKILAERKNDVKHLCLMGGRVHLNETSIEAIKREIKEETNYDTEYVRSVGLIENFYISKYTNKLCHEILIIHELEFKNQEAYLKEEIINNEEKDNAKFVWIDIEELKKLDLKPEEFIKNIDNKEFYHIINK